MSMKDCFLTNDIETTSIVNGGLREDTGVKVWKEGIPALLDLYDRFGVKATFFYIANFAREHPEMVRLVQDAGHEVALHGLTHDYRVSYDTMSLEEQVAQLTEAKRILEDITGAEVVSFRSPALRVNGFTPLALKETGFRFDSSVAPQRIDMFMSLGSKNKLQWLGAPRAPYVAAIDNLARRGESGIVEVPVSSEWCPYIGTFMRISPALTSVVRRFLYWETVGSRKVVNFLIHPQELLTEDDLHLATERRASNYFSYLLSDVLRRRLKQRNLGQPALRLFEREISFWASKGYAFKRVREVEVKAL